MSYNENIYYAVFYNKYDCNIEFDNVFAIIRESFFKTHQKQKNKVTNKLFNNTYHYSYCLEQDKPMKWKKMINGKLVEKSVPNKDSSYKIISFNENKKIEKIVHFTAEHIWVKSEYFNTSGQTKPKLIISSIDNKLSIYKYDDTYKKEKIDIVECDIDADQNELDAINASLQDCYLKVYSQKGVHIFCTPDGLENRKIMLDDLRISNKKLFNKTNELIDLIPSQTDNDKNDLLSSETNPLNHNNSFIKNY